MKSLDEYLTINNYENNCDKTRYDVTNANRERGNIELGILIGIVAAPLCAMAGTYLGEGLGYIWGNLMDCIPLVKDLAPWCARRAGLITDPKQLADLNENIYQTAGAVTGFWKGLFFPLNVALSYDKNELKK